MMPDARIIHTMRQLIELELEADVWDVGNPVVQVVALKGDEVIRETFPFPPGLPNFHSSIAVTYSAIVLREGMPSNLVDNLADTQVAGLLVFSEAWGLRVEREGLPIGDSAEHIAAIQEEIEKVGGIRNHPDARDHKIILFTDGFSQFVMSHTRGREGVDELGEQAYGETETPTDIALSALARQVRWALN